MSNSAPHSKLQVFVWGHCVRTSADGSRCFYSSFSLQGVNYNIGDAVLLHPESEAQPPYVGAIVTAYVDVSLPAAEQHCIQIKWFERARNLPHLGAVSDCELVELEETDVNPIGCISGKALVLRCRCHAEASQLAAAHGVVDGAWFFCRGVYARDTLMPYPEHLLSSPLMPAAGGERVVAQNASGLQKRGQRQHRAAAAVSVPAAFDEDVADSEDTRSVKKPRAQQLHHHHHHHAVEATPCEQQRGGSSALRKKAAGGSHGSSAGCGGAAAAAPVGGGSLGAAAAAVNPNSGRSCVECGATQTPQWREGPQGPKTLCNACGVRYGRQQNRAGKRCGGAGVSRAAAIQALVRPGSAAATAAHHQQLASTAPAGGAAQHAVPVATAGTCNGGASTAGGRERGAAPMSPTAAAEPLTLTAPGNPGARPVRQAAVLAANRTAEFARTGTFPDMEDARAASAGGLASPTAASAAPMHAPLAPSAAAMAAMAQLAVAVTGAAGGNGGAAAAAVGGGGVGGPVAARGAGLRRSGSACGPISPQAQPPRGGAHARGSNHKHGSAAAAAVGGNAGMHKMEPGMQLVGGCGHATAVLQPPPEPLLAAAVAASYESSHNSAESAQEALGVPALLDEATPSCVLGGGGSAFHPGLDGGPSVRGSLGVGASTSAATQHHQTGAALASPTVGAGGHFQAALSRDASLTHASALGGAAAAALQQQQHQCLLRQGVLSLTGDGATPVTAGGGGGGGAGGHAQDCSHSDGGVAAHLLLAAAGEVPSRPPSANTNELSSINNNPGAQRSAEQQQQLVSLRAVAARAALWVPGISRYAGVLSYVEEAPREALPPGLREVLQSVGRAVDRAADEAAAADAALAAVHQVLLDRQRAAARARSDAVAVITRMRALMADFVDKHPQLAVQGGMQSELVAGLPGLEDLDDNMMVEGCGLLQPCHEPAASLLVHHHAAGAGVGVGGGGVVGASDGVDMECGDMVGVDMGDMSVLAHADGSHPGSARAAAEAADMHASAGAGPAGMGHLGVVHHGMGPVAAAGSTSDLDDLVVAVGGRAGW